MVKLELEALWLVFFVEILDEFSIFADWRVTVVHASPLVVGVEPADCLVEEPPEGFFGTGESVPKGIVE